jgi:hypothetical protein
MGLQPNWRKASDGSLLRPNETSESREWPQICIGGTNGFFMVILTLAWWIMGADNDWKDETLCWAVDEAIWALGEVISLSRVGLKGGGGGVKRATDTTSEELGDSALPAKRWVDSCCDI